MHNTYYHNDAQNPTKAKQANWPALETAYDESAPAKEDSLFQARKQDINHSVDVLCSRLQVLHDRLCPVLNGRSCPSTPPDVAADIGIDESELTNWLDLKNSEIKQTVAAINSIIDRLTI